MLGRGLRPPLLVVSDRAPGLTTAVEMKLPQEEDFEHLISYLLFLKEHWSASVTPTSSSEPSARPAGARR